MGFMADYSDHFLIRGKDVSPHAADYLSGLLGTYRRKNMECIHGDIPDSNYQGIQQLLSDSPWSQDKLMDQVAAEANGLLGGNRHSALLIDETSFVKKGDRSVGVQRQYCGRLGKQENCQLSVFACLGLGDMALVALAMLFILKERVEHETSAPLLNARDIVELPAFYLPRRRRKEDEVVADLVRRHEQRQAATKSHARSQKKRLKIVTK